MDNLVEKHCRNKYYFVIDYIIQLYQKLDYFVFVRLGSGKMKKRQGNRIHDLNIH